VTTEAFETQIPARLDRLPWSRWHWLVVFALVITALDAAPAAGLKADVRHRTNDVSSRRSII
jgi:hypothetical protein